VETLYFDLLQFVYHLALAILVAGALVLGAAAAPAIFASVRSRGEAGAMFGAVLALIYGCFHSAGFARRLGDFIASVASAGLRLARRDPVAGWGDQLVHFRTEALGLVRKRWHWLTLGTLVGHLSVYLVLVVTLRAFGVGSDEVSLAEAFAAYADAHLAPEDLHELTLVDAVVSAADLTLELAQELERLAPFGLGNPDVTLLVPATQPVTPSTVGEGKHLRFRVRQHGRDAGTAIAFGQGGQLDRLRAEGLFDVACRLKENHWNGTVSPQLVVRRIFDTPEGYEEQRAALAELWRTGEKSWTAEARRIFEELGLDSDGDRGRRRQLLESESFRALLEGAAWPEAA